MMRPAMSGGHAVVDEDIHTAGFLRRKIAGDVKTLYLSGNPGGEGRRVETRDWADSALPGKQIVPGFGDAITDR